MKKHLLLLSALFLLAGCEGAEQFTPTDGGTYDPVADEMDMIDKLRRVNSLSDVIAPEEIYLNEVLLPEQVSVKANYSDNTSENVHPEVVQLDTSRLGNQTGVVLFEGKTTTFTILVKEEPGEAVKQPSKIEEVTFKKSLSVGDNVLLEDVDLLVTFDDESSETVHPTSILIDTSIAGPVNATVTYEKLTKIVSVNISGETHEKTLVSLSYVSGLPSEIALGGSISPSSVTLSANYSDNTSEQVHPTSIELDTSAVGTASGKCNYQGLSYGFQIEVVDSSTPIVTITGIEVTSAPTSVNVGESITTSQVTITIKKSDNSVELANPTSIDFTSAVAGTVTAVAHYNEFEANFTVTVIDPDEEEEEEEVLMCTYRIYFSYSHTTKYNPDTKKDEDSPLLQFAAPMLFPLGHAPAEIAKDGDNTKVDAAKVESLGATMGFSKDPAFPNFLGFSAYGICLSTDQLWDFTVNYKQQAVVNLYGVWVD